MPWNGPVHKHAKLQVFIEFASIFIIFGRKIMSTITKSRKPKVTVETASRSGPALMTWRRERGISRELFAELADFSVRKLATYEKADPLPKKIARPVTQTLRLTNALRELAGDDHALKDWLNTSNPAFGNQTPLGLIRSGESDQLWEMVHQIRQRVFA